jgi:hypothetical protein
MNDENQDKREVCGKVEGYFSGKRTHWKETKKGNVKIIHLCDCVPFTLTFCPNHQNMPSRAADSKKSKRDPRLRPLHAPTDPWAWIVEEPVRKVVLPPVDHNVNGLETKPSFYAMVKQALLANKMHYLRGVSMNAIYKYVAANWPVDLDTYRRLTRVAVKRALDAGKLELVGAVGVTYRLAPAERPNHSEKKQKVEEDDEKPKKRNPPAKGVTSTKRGKTAEKSQKKRKVVDDSSDEDEAPRKKPAAKKKANKASKARLQGGDHLEQQVGEGKWVRARFRFFTTMLIKYL